MKILLRNPDREIDEVLPVEVYGGAQRGWGTE
jgi:hypothetical protein